MKTTDVSKWLRVTNESENSITVDIDGVIGWDEGSWPEIKKILTDLATKAKDELIVNIYSLGGFIDDGLMIHDALKMTKARVTTRAFSFVASAATVIAQAGDIRQMSSNGLYLIHKSSALAWGNVNEMKTVLQDLQTIDDRIMNLYARRAKVDTEVIRGLMEENNGLGKWLSADEALQYGLIDQILIPSKAVAQFNPEYFEKYHLPQIPENIMKNLTLSEAQPKKGVLTKVVDFLTSLGLKVEDDKEPETIVEQITGESSAEAETSESVPEQTETTEGATDAEETSEETEKKEGVEEPSGETEDAEQTTEELEEVDQEKVDLKNENSRLATEIADLKKTLEESQTKLAQAGARSTKPAGVVGKEDPDTPEDPKKASWMADVRKLLSVYNFGTLNPSPKK